jgi:selenide,water dikinase
MGPEALAQVLQPLSLLSSPDLVVGLQTSDDAAVFRLTDEIAVIQTADFFAPIVDDPFTYGAIAATNSMSDVYAMGGEVLFALNIVGFPDDLPAEVLTAILSGGASKVEEAGGVVAGGHTVVDQEPKYGLSVTGRVHPDQVWRKSGARPGDVLVLTKPIGTGVISTAIKNSRASANAADASIASMLRLNRDAMRLGRGVDIHACTDITGFGLLGHAYEMASKGGVSLTISASGTPLLPEALHYAAVGQQPGGLRRNRAYYSGMGVTVSGERDDALTALLFDPQTSGGLLLAMSPDDAASYHARAEQIGQTSWTVGEVGSGVGVTVVP